MTLYWLLPVSGVSQVSGQVNLKDFNIQTKSIEQARPAMQKLLSIAKLDSKAAAAVPTTVAVSTQAVVVGENTNSKTSTTTAVAPTSTPSVAAALNNNDPEKSSGNPKANVMNEASNASAAESCLSGSSSQVSEMGSDCGGESEQTQSEVAASSLSSPLNPFDSEDKMNEMMKASERLEAFISKMMRRAELLHTTSEEQSLQKQQILEELQKVEQELQEKAKNPLLLLNAQSKQDMMFDQSKMALLQEDLPFDDDEDECHQPYGMTLPVMICEAGSHDVDAGGGGGGGGVESLKSNTDQGHSQASTKSAKDEAVIIQADAAHDGGTVCHEGSEVKTAQLAKQESLSSASNVSSSSADSGCGNSDFNGVCMEGSEVDRPPLAPRLELAEKQPDDGSAEQCKSNSSPSKADGKHGASTQTANDPSATKTAKVESRLGEQVSRASSEEVDLTNVIPVMDARDESQIDKHLQVLCNHELLQQHVQEQLKAGTG